MKLTPHEKRIEANFQPGKITKDGFLGSDTRHVHDIIQADSATLSRLGVNQQVIADRLRYFINEGKKGLEGNIELGNFIVRVIWTKGMMPCPFGEPGIHRKIIATVHNTKLRREITYSQLNVHMIEGHGFFEGNGSCFRLEPEELVTILEIKK